jgi:hypothetical protein
MTEPARPQIDASKLVVGGGIVGAIFTVGSMLIFLTGLPILRYKRGNKGEGYRV